MEKSSFVRKRRWARACETCSKKPLRQPGAPKPSIVFSEETVFKRQLENKKWRTCAATRNGPRWVQQYRVDCRSCGIDSRRSLAAFLASDAYGAFNRQAAARKLLAGLYQWPEGSPATTIAESKSGGNLEVLCDEIFGQLIEDIARLGVEEGCDQAMKTLAMIALNAQARANDPNTTTATVDPAPGHAAPAAEAPTPAARAAQGEGADLNKFIDQSILDMSKMKSEVEALDMGWDAADGWFVVDDGDELLVRAKADRADAKMTTKQHHQNDVEIVAHVMLPRAKADRPGDSSDTVPAAPAQDGGGAMSRAALDDLDLYNGAGPPVAVAEDHRSSVARSVYVDAVSEQVPPPMSAVVTGPGDGSAASSAPPPTDAMDTSLLELSSVYFDANDGDVGGDGDGGGPATTAARADTPPGPGADRKEKVMAEIALLRKIMADNNMPNPPAGH